jgi:hypothetical protein
VENGRRTHEDEDMVVGGKVRLEPDDGSQVQMRGRLVEQKQMGLDEERPSKSDSHPPTSGHVLGRLGHHGGGKTETVEDGSGLGLESGRVELLDLLVDGLEGELVDVVGNGKLLSNLLESVDLLLGGSDTVVESVDVARVDGSSDEVNLRMATLEIGKRPYMSELW